MSGEMIVALSQRPIDDQQNKYLVCHIASTPSTKKTEYIESSSYLADRDPREYQNIVKEQQFLTHSKVFHRACDLENPLIYCLKLEKTNGLVTLSHAGPNTLYNQQKIAHRFSSSKFDLNYIQISAGSQPVPVRNLLVSPREIEEFYPSIDEHFQRSARRSPKEAKAVEPLRSPSGAVSSVIHSVGNFLGLRGDAIERTPCRHSVNCREQGSEEHCRKYSHPCRFSELCRNQEKELHLTHERHRIKYSHGEEVSVVPVSAVPRPRKLFLHLIWIDDFSLHSKEYLSQDQSPLLIFTYPHRAPIQSFPVYGAGNVLITAAHIDRFSPTS